MRCARPKQAQHHAALRWAVLKAADGKLDDQASAWRWPKLEPPTCSSTVRVWRIKEKGGSHTATADAGKLITGKKRRSGRITQGLLLHAIAPSPTFRIEALALLATLSGCFPLEIVRRQRLRARSFSALAVILPDLETEIVKRWIGPQGLRRPSPAWVVERTIPGSTRCHLHHQGSGRTSSAALAFGSSSRPFDSMLRKRRRSYIKSPDGLLEFFKFFQPGARTRWFNSPLIKWLFPALTPR